VAQDTFLASFLTKRNTLYLKVQRPAWEFVFIPWRELRSKGHVPQDRDTFRSGPSLHAVFFLTDLSSFFLGGGVVAELIVVDERNLE
jgi:hypothetical protein